MIDYFDDKIHLLRRTDTGIVYLVTDKEQIFSKHTTHQEGLGEMLLPKENNFVLHLHMWFDSQ